MKINLETVITELDMQNNAYGTNITPSVYIPLNPNICPLPTLCGELCNANMEKKLRKSKAGN